MLRFAGRAIALIGFAALVCLSLAASDIEAAHTKALQPRQPSCANRVTLYDAGLGGTPDTQGLLYQSLAISATQTFSDGATLFDSLGRRADQAGYVANPATTPTLDRTSGYTLTFQLQVLDEQHSNANRAGFSIVALSSDARGIELGFWHDEIWAQADGEAEPPGGTLFTHAEGIVFDTSLALITYTLAIQGDEYHLSANGAPTLSGALRDYSAFMGPIDPYETPNFVFLGDNTTSAAARIRFAGLSITTALPCQQHSIFLPLVVRE